MTSVLHTLLRSLHSTVRSRAALQLEILALRHQLLVLQRTMPRRLPVGGEFQIDLQTPLKELACCDFSRICIRIRLDPEHGAHDGIQAVDTA